MAEQQILHQALTCHQAGQLAQAEHLYRRVLQENPRNADALNLLGVLANQQGRFEVAIECIGRALAIDRNAPDFHFNLGEACRGAGRLEEAVAAYQRALRLQPDDPQAYHAMGQALQQQGKLQQAIDALREAIRLNPEILDAYDQLAGCLMSLGRAEEASQLCQQVLSRQPDRAITHFNLGAALARLGNHAQAASCFQRAAQLKPDLAEAHLNLAIAQEKLGQMESASASCRQALQLKPDFPEAFNYLGVLMDKQGRQQEAIAAYRESIRLRQDNPDAHSNLANTLKDRMLLEESLTLHRQAIQLRDDGGPPHSNYLMTLNYHPSLDVRLIFQEHLRWGQRVAPMFPPLLAGTDRDPGRRLRVAYLSPDLREHSVSYFIEAILSCRQQDAFEVYCYSDADRPDAVTARLRAAADHWRETASLSDTQLLETLRQDRIDILVELAGHTSGNRLRALAMRASPIQISYLGYPNTTGLPRWCMNYRLTDELADPPGQTDDLHTEKLLRLPGCFVCYRPRTDSPAVSEPPFEKTGCITFGCFNHLAKVNTPLLQLWASLLAAVPRSRLMLKARPLADRSTQQLVAEAFAQHGIAHDRLILCGPEPSASAHLARYAQVDIALDTYPYHGTTTSCEAMWMGVPVVSLAGPTHRSRVGVTLLTTVGLPELIASTPQEYVEIARALAGDPARLRELRRHLRQRMDQSALTDGPAFARKLEQAYRAVWQEWCNA